MNGTFLRRSLLPLFLFAFVLVRLVVLFYPDSAGWAAVDDELPTGNIAVDVGRGLLLPAPAYQFKPFAAGTMIEGLLSAPWRWLCGPNLLALKAAAITIHLLAFCFWFWALWRIGGRVAAIVYGVLAVFPPPAWLHLTHTAWGNHAEQSLFVGVILFLLVSAWRRQREGLGNGRSFLLGLTAGCATYFAYSGAPTILWVLVMVAWIGSWRRLPAALGGVFVGLAPLVWSASFFGWRALGRIDTYTGYAAGEMVSIRQYFLESDLGFIPVKLLRLLVVDLPTASLYRAAWGRWLFFALTLAAVAVIAIWVRRIVKDDTTRARAAIGLLVYGVIYGGVLVFSGFRLGQAPVTVGPIHYMEFRYLAPLFPVALAALALGVQALWDWLHDRWAPQLALIGVAVVLMLALSLPYYGSLRRPEAYSPIVLQVRGDSYGHVVERLAVAISRNRLRRAEKVEAVERLSPDHRRLFFEMLGKTGPTTLPLAYKLAGEIDPLYATDVARGFGRHQGAALAELPPDRVADRLLQYVREDPQGDAEHRAALMEGRGIGYARQARLAPRRILGATGALAAADPASYEAWCMGVGQFAGATLSVDLGGLRGMPACMWRGYGKQARRNAENVLLSKEPIAPALLHPEKQIRAAIFAGYREAGEL
ncbi:MAG: hypothetical protein P9L99_02545 [Candidatus Lernaella stagnicola]|nr:hypothetical protein [Candidatus Lernaella stagnicola]